MSVEKSSSMRERMIYRSIAAKLKKQFPNTHKEFIISPGYLRSERTLTNTSAKYDFELKKANGADLNTEVKLDRNDLFVVSRIGLHLTKRVKGVEGSEILQTYPNPVVFGAPALPAHMEAIYNGYSSFKVGKVVNIENLSNQEFRHVPFAQAGSTATNSEFNTNLSYEVPALIYLNGTSDLKYSVEFPAIPAMQIAGDPARESNQLVLKFYGFLVKGAAEGK